MVVDVIQYHSSEGTVAFAKLSSVLPWLVGPSLAQKGESAGRLL